MTRFSREEIYQEFMGNLAGTYKEMAYQLLEENRILREGLDKYADEKLWSSGDCGAELHSCHFYTAKTKGYEIAQETFSKADSVGKEKE